MGVSMSQGKGVQVGGVSQNSHQGPIDTPKPTSEIPPKGEILHHTHPNNQHDDETMCKSNVVASDSLNFDNSDCKSNQISLQSPPREQFYYLNDALNVCKTHQIEDQATLSEYPPKDYSEGIEVVSKFFEVLMELQRSENDQESVQLEEDFSNMVVLRRKSCFCDDFAKKHEKSEVSK